MKAMEYMTDMKVMKIEKEAIDPEADDEEVGATADIGAYKLFCKKGRDMAWTVVVQGTSSTDKRQIMCCTMDGLRHCDDLSPSMVCQRVVRKLAESFAKGHFTLTSPLKEHQDEAEIDIALAATFKSEIIATSNRHMLTTTMRGAGK